MEEFKYSWLSAYDYNKKIGYEYEKNNFNNATNIYAVDGLLCYDRSG